MSEVGFVLREMTHLRYWMPLVLEGNSRGLKSVFYIAPSQKYNCPFLYRDKIKDLAKKHNIEIRSIGEVKKCTGVLFSSENRWGIEILKKIPSTKKVVCTYQTDFVESYNNFYKEVADYILMPSEFCAKYYSCTEGNNLYLGIPKYDVSFTEAEALKNNKLQDTNNVLLIWPKNRDLGRVNMERFLKLLLKSGFRVLAKTRGTDPIPRKYKEMLKKSGGRHLEDRSWFPHTTQELLEVSKLVINFGSTTVEECVMHNVPLINFDIKPSVRNGNKKRFRVTHDYLYDYDYCIQLKTDFTPGQLQTAATYLTSADLTEEFKRARQNHLFDHKESCKRILDMLI